MFGESSLTNPEDRKILKQCLQEAKSKFKEDIDVYCSFGSHNKVYFDGSLELPQLKAYVKAMELMADRRNKHSDKKTSEWIKEKPTVDGYYWYKIIDSPSEHASILMKALHQCITIHYSASREYRIGNYRLEDMPDDYEYSLIKPPTDESNGK